MNKLTVAQTAEFFKTHDNFTLICHANPDGDTLGSGYGLCGALHIMGKHARVICDEPASPRFDFLKRTLIHELSTFPEDENETIVTVDVADLELSGALKNKYTEIDLCIDHHVSNKGYADALLIDTEAAACAEVVWGLIKALGVDITPEIAAAIYTGISTDTGCFRYANTTAQSHAIAAELMGYDFDVANLNYVMFEMKTKMRLELEQQVLSGIEYYFGGRCAVVVLTADVLEGIDSEDTGNISTLPRQIEKVLAGITIKQKPAHADSGEIVWKVSVRTAKSVNAQMICSKLGGGGHLCAAGCTLKGGIMDVKRAILDEVEKQL